jgi:hypothetical protein
MLALARLAMPAFRRRLARAPVEAAVELDAFSAREPREQPTQAGVVRRVREFERARVPEQRIELGREADGEDRLELELGRADERPRFVVRRAVDVRPRELPTHEVDEHVCERLEVVSARAL